MMTARFPWGVHRAQVPRWRSWVPLLAIIIIVPALAWGAVTLIINGKGIWETFSGSSDAVSSTQPAQGGQAAGKKDEGKKDEGKKDAAASAKPSASASASGNVDFNTKVMVSNGTYTGGLAKGGQ